MLNIHKRDIFTSTADIIAITTNSVLNNKGHLVMGAGLAKQAKIKYPELPRLAGKWIKASNLEYGLYGWTVINLKDRQVGLLQTKKDWRDPSNITLILDSLIALQYYMTYLEPEVTVAMPLPGIGLGGLSRTAVVKCLEEFLTPSIVKRILVFER